MKKKEKVGILIAMSMGIVYVLHPQRPIPEAPGADMGLTYFAGRGLPQSSKPSNSRSSALLIYVSRSIPFSPIIPGDFMANNSSHVLDDAADLVIWDITEATVTMIAACIPVLRILVRDLRSTVQYGSDNRMELQNVDTGHRWRTTVIVDSKTNPSPTTQNAVPNGDDQSDRSDKSILDNLAS